MDNFKKYYDNLNPNQKKAVDITDGPLLILAGPGTGKTELLSVRAAKMKLKVAEIPGDEPRREGGERKLQVLKWGAAYMFEVLREVVIWK